MGNIGETNIGLTYKPSDITDSSGTLVLRSSNIKNNNMCYLDNVYVSCSIPEKSLIHKNDLLICARNGSRLLVGKSAIFDREEAAFGAFMAKFCSDYNYYIKVFLDSPLFRLQLEGVKTETINQITQFNLKQQLLPFPPLSEQQRIIEKLNQLEPLIEKYKSAEEKLYELNSNIKEQLKKSILQYAIEGKMVPQDPNDEPASILLERIRNEKEKLIAEGKIKKDKNESIIYRRDNSYYEKQNNIENCINKELPFEIPNSWEWIRLGSLTYNHGQKKPNCNFCYIDIGSINNEEQTLNKGETVLSADKAPSRARKIVKFGDILYSTVRPYLHNMCIINRSFTFEPIASTGFAVLTCHSNYLNEFLFMYMMSPIFNEYANSNENSKGVAYPAINDSRLSVALVPVLPASEQQKIIDNYKKIIHILS